MLNVVVYMVTTGLLTENQKFRTLSITPLVPVLGPKQLSLTSSRSTFTHSVFSCPFISSYRHLPSPHCVCLWRSVHRCSILITVTVCTWPPLLLHSRRAQQVLLSRIMSDVMSYRFIWLPAEYRSVTMATRHVSCALAPFSPLHCTRNGGRLQKLGLDVL